MMNSTMGATMQSAEARREYRILIQLNNTRTDSLERFYHILKSDTMQEVLSAYNLESETDLLRLTEKEYAHFLLKWA